MRPEDERGRESASVRRSCALPLAWDLPDPDRIARLLAAIDQLLDGRRRPPVDAIRQAIVMILLTLQTGRSREALIDVRVQHGGLVVEGCPAPTIRLTDEGDYILLAPVKSTIPSRAAEYRTVHDHIILPLCGRLRRALASGTDGTIAAGQVFTLPSTDLDRGLRRLLRGGSDWRDRTVKAERGLPALERWLRHRLRIIEGGDPALCAILDADRAGAERTVSAYATISADRYWRAYRKALSPIDGAIPRTPPAMLAPLAYGNPRCPDDAALKTVLARVTWLSDRSLIRLSGNDGPPDRTGCLGPLSIRRDCHLAKMIHCYALATFGTGQRGIGRLVGLNEIDPETGFAWVVEKANVAGGHGGERAVFHGRTVRRQLAAYEEYLDTVAKALARTAPPLAAQLAALRAEGGIVFFDVRPRGLVRLSLGGLCRAAQEIGWFFDKNAGRRWLRSALIGRVPSDALAAQFGHHLDGLDIWSKYSGVDPQAVSGALGPAIERALASIGLTATPVKRCRASKAVAPTATTASRSARHRSGEILASAIWHGAMLDRDQEAVLIEKLHAASRQPSLPEWIDFEARYRKPYRRWFIDMSTRMLIDRWRDDEGAMIAGAPDLILRDFLGSDVVVDDWHASAVRRWRYRLPPLLHAQACGQLDNHSLPATRFDPTREPKAAPTWSSDKRRRQRRDTCDEFISLLERYWKHAGKPPSGWRRQLSWRRKRDAYHALRRVLDDAPVYRRMSPLEQSLARGLVEGLQQDRGHLNPRGYAMTTIVQRAERLWRDFIPLERKDWESRPIDELDGSDISRRIIPPMPWRSEVAHDLLKVLEALPETARSRDAIEGLRNRPENYTADVLTPAEYDRAQEHGQEAWIKPALALCYRTGLRFGELTRIDRERILFDDDGPALLVLDHGRTGRLKTFHSRRRIPLDTLLTVDERQSLAMLIAAPLGRGGRIFPYLDADNPAIEAALRSGGGDGMRVYPLRHAFATNALAAMLWPTKASGRFERFFDPILLERRAAFRARLCGPHSLGGCGPHAIAGMMGHTSPYRTLFSYAHHLEVILAAYVERHGNTQKASARDPIALREAA